MNRYRKKPVVIEAFRFMGPGTVPNEAYHAVDVGHRGDTAVIHTIEGDMVAQRGDWIIKGIQGEYYPCKPAIFEATYELVEVSA